MNNIYGAVSNGLTLSQYSRIVDFVEQNIFDGCGGRKIRSIYLMENGKMFRRGKVSQIQSRCRSYVCLTQKKIVPITNLDRIVANIVNVTSDNPIFADWIKNREELKTRILEII